MVEKRRRKIAKKPETELSPDSWVSEGGLDPEIKLPASVTTAHPDSDSEEPSEEKKEGQEKSYPHRISFDLASPQYKRLKYASFDSDRPMNSILREAVEEWMKARNY